MKRTTVFLIPLLTQLIECGPPRLETTAGPLGFLGDFSGLSIAHSPNQTYESGHHLLRQLARLGTFDGPIQTTCETGDSLYLAGEFQNVNGIESRYLVRFRAGRFEAIEGLDGPVRALLCEAEGGVYVGGEFERPFGHVARWKEGWERLPWIGFDGPVWTIKKVGDRVLFGGRFSSIGDVVVEAGAHQMIPISSSTLIRSGNNGFQSDPKKIVCPFKTSPESEGVWYLQEGVPGYWDANFLNPIQPTMFRLANTHTERGTLSFNILALGSNEYFDLSYVDPVTQQTLNCTMNCILSNATFQDFKVSEPKSTRGIRININSWYGQGGGLGYVQLFESDISLNPHMDSICNPSSGSTQTTIKGDWKDVFVYGSYQSILQATLPFSELKQSDTTIIYQPNIPTQAHYEIYATTPGCVGSSNCFERTQVEYQLELSPGFSPIKIKMDQNVFSDERRLIYSGPISASREDFRPTITLRPANDARPAQNGQGQVSIMADTVEFIKNKTSTTFVSVLEFNPTLSVQAWKPLNQQLPLGSTVYTIEVVDDFIYLGGSFSMDGIQNIVGYHEGRFVPLNSSLNGKVSKILYKDQNLYVGGEFNRSEPELMSLPHIAKYDLTKKTWNPLGQGVDGSVTHISSHNQTLTISGEFRYSDRLSIGNALWNITRGEWETRASLVVGQITTEEGPLMGDKLFVGGQFRSRNQSTSLIIYDLLNKNKFLPITGVYDEHNNPGTVHVIKSHPDGKRVIVGGEFNRVGLFDCGPICVVDPSIRQWNKVGIGLSGTVYDLVTIHEKVIAVGKKDNQPMMASLTGQVWTLDKPEELPGIPKMILNSTNDELIIAGESSTALSGIFLGSFNRGQYTEISNDFGVGTKIHQILFVPVSSNENEKRYPVGSQTMLLVVGHLNMTDYGKASAALYDGSTWYPYILSSTAEGKPGVIYQIIHTTDFNGILSIKSKEYLSVAIVILISIGLSLGVLFLMSAIGVLILYKHRNRLELQNNPLLASLGLFGTMGITSFPKVAERQESRVYPNVVFSPLETETPISPSTTIVNPLGQVSQPLGGDVFYTKFPFKAQEVGELSFEAGEAITVTDRSNPTWWLGHKEDGSGQIVSGVFPSNYMAI